MLSTRLFADEFLVVVPAIFIELSLTRFDDLQDEAKYSKSKMRVIFCMLIIVFLSNLGYDISTQQLFH